MHAIQLENVQKRFGATVAIANLSLDIALGELFFLLGPSGCGKSTLLRLIAGLLDLDGGRILFNGKDVSNLGTERRNAVMCFQSYALWPHMTVRENVRFGLNVRHMPAAEQKRRVDEVLGIVRMERYAERKPNQLSGGQQQRVALARALAVKPDCLLLDEPLSNLDTQLRLEMRSEIRRICKTGGFTAVYVTHDQKEALSVADRIAVLKDGRLAQVGTPAELYQHPSTTFVAEFMGHTNLIPGKVLESNGDLLRVESKAGTVLAPGNSEVGREIVLSIRPEHLHLNGAASGSNRFTGRVLESTFLGESSEHVLNAGGQMLRFMSTPPMLNPPQELTLECDPKDVVVLLE